MVVILLAYIQYQYVGNIDAIIEQEEDDNDDVIYGYISKFIEDDNEIEILAIGIGHDVSRYYKKAIKITDVQELGDVMIGQLSGLFENKKKLH